MPPLMSSDPRRCVILVPFLGFIHQECDDALKELERRGYTVRRVGGYAAIDQARNQMATDALRDGFEETIWIDADVGFHADAVERLRSHALPMVCGVYPKKGQRAVACHVMPGTPSMLFGEGGGLVEVMYAATGFLLVRREAYLAIQNRLRLPVCNERFGQPLIPFFLPMIHPLEGGHWYLAEDYAFCQRARAAGLRIFADTTIRLWHIGTYRYGWEDSGLEPQRFATFNLSFGDQQSASPTVPPKTNEALDGRCDLGETIAVGPHPDPLPEGEGSGTTGLNELKAQNRWPSEKPNVPLAPQRDWLFPSTREVLARAVPHESRLIVELGSWTGRSTRYLADLAPQATVIAIDHWEGSVEHAADPELADFLPRLYDTFLAECWDYRGRVIPMRTRTVDGLLRIAQASLRPDLIYIDADHQYESVVADLTTALNLFPGATIVGDDWDWPSVRSAVETVTGERKVPVEVVGVAWRIPGKR
jgi:hypothetical protein